MKQKHGIIRSFYFAFLGIKQALNERNFRIHLIVSCCVIVLGFFLKINHTEWLFLTTCIGAVLSLEIINTSIESMLDVLHPDYHPAIGRIKDLSAAAVLIVAIASIIIGLIIFLPKIWQVLN